MSILPTTNMSNCLNRGHGNHSIWKPRLWSCGRRVSPLSFLLYICSFCLQKAPSFSREIYTGVASRDGLQTTWLSRFARCWRTGKHALQRAKKYRVSTCLNVTFMRRVSHPLVEIRFYNLLGYLLEIHTHDGQVSDEDIQDIKGVVGVLYAGEFVSFLCTAQRLISNVDSDALSRCRYSAFISTVLPKSAWLQFQIISVLETFFLAMLHYPDVYRKAREEIDPLIECERLPLEALVMELYRHVTSDPCMIPS
jgi:hypothetical protein